MKECFIFFFFFTFCTYSILVNVLFSYFSLCLFPLFIFLHWCYSHFHLFKLGVCLVWFTCKYANNETFHYLGLTLMHKMSHASCIHYSSDCITCHACRNEVIPWWGPWPVSVHVWLCFTIKSSTFTTIFYQQWPWIIKTIITIVLGSHVHSKTPHVVTVLWQDSDDVVTVLSPTRNLVEGYKTMYLCHLDSYTVTVCNGYQVSAHVVTIQLPTRYLYSRQIST